MSRRADGIASTKQLNYLKYLIAELQKQYNDIIPEDELDSHASLVLEVYKAECIDGPLTTSRATSLIDTTKDLLEEIKCLVSISQAN